MLLLALASCLLPQSSALRLQQAVPQEVSNLSSQGSKQANFVGLARSESEEAWEAFPGPLASWGASLDDFQASSGQVSAHADRGEKAPQAKQTDETMGRDRDARWQGEAAKSYNLSEGLFHGSDAAHHSYRIPSIVSVGGDRLIAFAEGRLYCAGDSGNINLVYKLSEDNGRTWSALRYLSGTNDGTKDTWGNPTVVFERPWEGGPPRGRVHLFFNYNENEFHEFPTTSAGCPKSKRAWRPVQHGDRQTYYVFSDDAGQTWSLRRNFTEQLLPNELTWDAAGPGVGIQKLFEPNKSMLVIPANSRNFISSDHGSSWTSVMATSNSSQLAMSESTVAECLDGRLYRNDRAGGRAHFNSKSRYVIYLSRPDQPSESISVPATELTDPRSQASLLSFAPDMLLFLNSDDSRSRFKMRVHLSRDCGRTWPIKRYLYDDNALGKSRKFKGGYSSMTKTDDLHVAALSEAVVTDPNTGAPIGLMSIDLIRFDMDWLCQDASFCRGSPCPVIRGGAGSFVTQQHCVEAALGARFLRETNSSVLARVQHRRKGELVSIATVRLSPAAPGSCAGDQVEGPPLPWREADSVLFAALSSTRDLR